MDTWTKTVTVLPDQTLVVDDVVNGHTGEVTIVADLSGTGNIDITKTSGAGTATADGCQYSGGVIINNDGAIENNTNNVVNNTGTTEYNTGVTEVYDVTSLLEIFGDINSYGDNFFGGDNFFENITVEGGNIAITGGWNFEGFS